MQTFQVRIEGVAPLLMHNARLADRTNGFTKAINDINAKRKKTDEDEAERSRLEWYGGFYGDPPTEVDQTTKSRPILPSDVLWACIVEGAKITKDGKTAAAGILHVADAHLEYYGPKNADALFESGRFIDRRIAVVGQSRIMRTRPKFDSWAAAFALVADTGTTIKNAETVRTWIENAGQYKGIGDYRPRFGRFDLKEFKEVQS